jgi:hypothetical protein
MKRTVIPECLPVNKGFKPQARQIKRARPLCARFRPLCARFQTSQGSKNESCPLLSFLLSFFLLRLFSSMSGTLYSLKASPLSNAAPITSGNVSSDRTMAFSVISSIAPFGRRSCL